MEDRESAREQFEALFQPQRPTDDDQARIKLSVPHLGGVDRWPVTEPVRPKNPGPAR